MQPEGNCFSMTWKVENMTLCSVKKNEPIKSPPFVYSMDGTRWQLRLYPRGAENCPVGGVTVFLVRKRYGSSAFTTKKRFEIAFIGKDGSVLESRAAEFVFAKGTVFDMTLVKQEEFFHSKRSIFLPGDVLTVRCRMWKRDETMLQDVRLFACTQIAVETGFFQWSVENFDTLELKKRCCYMIQSPNKNTPLLSVDFYLTEGENSNQIIRFVLIRKDESIEYATIKLSLVGASGNRLECNEEEFFFDGQPESTRFTFFFSREMLLSNKKMYLPNATLSIYVEWAVSMGVVSSEIQEKSDIQDEDRIRSRNCLFENIKTFYDEQFLCDVKLKTRTTLFPAHKVILSACSSVFKSRFESGGGCLTVDMGDLDDDTVRRMLHYIYTSSVGDLTWESATALFSAASKNGIPNLKSVCSSYLMERLSRSNACEALLLADNHADVELKTSVLNYIEKEGKEVVNSEWRLLMNTNIRLAAEALHNLFSDD